MNNFILYKEMPIRSLYENSIFNAYRNDDIFLYSIRSRMLNIKIISSQFLYQIIYRMYQNWQTVLFPESLK